MQKKLSSISIFFPFFNDAGTVIEAVSDAYYYGRQLAKQVEVIAIHGGNSSDGTQVAIAEAKKKHPNLVIIDKRDNKDGYAVIKHGFASAKNDWVFYTDGDLQYRLHDLRFLVEEQIATGVDVVNGYKINRADAWYRILCGNIYSSLSRRIFRLPISDADCDFRLIRKKLLRKINLNATDASILLELVKKLEYVGAKFSEVPISHYPRRWGKSNYHVWRLVYEKTFGDFVIWHDLLKDKTQSSIKHTQVALSIVPYMMKTIPLLPSVQQIHLLYARKCIAICQMVPHIFLK